MAKAYRNFLLKVVEYAEEGDPIILPIDELIRQIFGKSPEVGDRHVPPINEVEEGKQCSFIDEISKAPGSCPGITFRFGSYLKGERPPGLKPDFSHATVEISPSVLKDVKTNEPREPASAFHALAFGSAIIIEFVKGAGGIALLEKCLTELARRYVHGKYPSIHLKDVASRELSDAIDRAGGVQEVILDVSSARKNPSHELAGMLRDVRTMVRNTDLLRLQYRADKESNLSKADILTIQDNYKDHEIDKMVVVLKGGETFVGEKCKVRKRVDFPHEPIALAIIREMAKYLLDLQKIEKDVSVLTADGRLPSA